MKPPTSRCFLVVAFLVALLILAPAERASVAQPRLVIDGRAAAVKPDPACPTNTGRFRGCNNGTVIDQVTGLLWLRRADCIEFPGAGGSNTTNWPTAMAGVAALGDGLCSLSDGSQPGDWRLPTSQEWEATVGYVRDILDCGGPTSPIFPNDAGNDCWDSISLFSFLRGIERDDYWARRSTTCRPAWPGSPISRPERPAVVSPSPGPRASGRSAIPDDASSEPRVSARRITWLNDSSASAKPPAAASRLPASVRSSSRCCPLAMPGSMTQARREIDVLPSKIVGRRREPEATLAATDVLLRTVRDLRAGGLAPRGLYRFESFEEAQKWMRSQMARRSGLQRSRTSAGSAVP